MRSTIKFIALVGSAVCVLALGAVSASATTTVSMSSGIVTVTTASGVDNDISAFKYSTGYKVYEQNDTISAGSGCTLVGTAVRCNSVAAIIINTGDGDDFVSANYVDRNLLVDAGAGDDYVEGGNYSGYSDTLVGGDGNDELLGFDGNDTLYGQDGDDHIEGGDGDDTIDGGDEAFGAATPDTLLGDDGDDTITSGTGDSVLDGGAGADELIGGPNWNVVTYASRSASVYVTANNNVADDGESGEHDRVSSSVDQIDGGSGDDQITASSSAAYGVLNGNAGDDTLTGNDQSFGDTIDGGSGADTINGMGGTDLILVDDGDDDQTDCGAGGSDTVYADALPLDSTVTGCEHVNR